MKTLADLKRAIKPGVRLRCIKNQYRPELDGGVRVVVRVFTGQFTWLPDPLPKHAITISEDGMAATCDCGWTFKAYTNESPETGRIRVKEWSDAHLRKGTPESWLRYAKASMFTFDGSNAFKMRLDAADSKYVHLEIL